MTWTQNATTKAWTKTGATREVVLATTPFPGKSAVRLNLIDTAQAVAVAAFSSPDGNTCFECGVVGANVVVQRVIFAAAPVVNTNTGTNDIPASGNPASAAHGVTAGTPFVLEVRILTGLIEIWVNGVLKLRHTLDPTVYATVANPFTRQTSYGFVSSVAGANVAKAQICNLIESEPTPQTEVGFVVCNGDVFYTEDMANFQRIAAGAFGNSGSVALREHRGLVYGVGTGFCKILNPVALTVGNWTASAGTMPGSSGLPAGQTRMTILENFLDCLALSGDPQDGQNVYISAVGNPRDHDTAADSPGRAFALGTGGVGKLGAPVTCLFQLSKGTLGIGCINQVWRLRGHPAFGLPDLSPVLLNAGLSGKDSATLATDGVGIAHGPEGAYIIPDAAPAVPLSQTVLSKYLTFTRDEIGNYYVQVVRDAKNKIVWFFMTPITSGPAIHLAYCERVGRFIPDVGGWFPQQTLDVHGPTATFVFRGELIMGTRNGSLLKFSDAETGDNGQAFTTKCPLQLVDPPANNNDVGIGEIDIVLGDESDSAELRVYSGRTPEEARTGASRTLLWSRRIVPHGPAIRQNARGPALSVELWDEDPASTFTFEEAEIEYETYRRRGRAGRKPALALHQRCAPPATETPSVPGPGSGTLSIQHLVDNSVYTGFSGNQGSKQDYWKMNGAGGLPDRRIGPVTGLGGGGVAVN